MTESWLRDIELLKQHKAKYGDCVDRCPADGAAAAEDLAQLFTEDAVLDFTELFGQTLTGRDELRRFFGQTVHRNRVWMWHAFVNPMLEVEGDRARGRWLLYAMSKVSIDVPPKVTYGRYEDEYVRTANGWLQSRLRFRNETPELSAATAQAAGEREGV